MNFDLWIRKPPSNKSVHKSISLEWIHFSVAACTFLTDFYCVCLFVLSASFFFPSLLTYATPGLDTPRCGLLRLDAVTKNRIVVVISCLSGHTQLAASTTIQSNQHTTWFYTFLSTWSWSQQLFGILQALIVVVVQLVRTADCRIAELTVYRLVGRSNCRAAGQVESHWFRSTCLASACWLLSLPCVPKTFGLSIIIHFRTLRTFRIAQLAFSASWSATHRLGQAPS